MRIYALGILLLVVQAFKPASVMEEMELRQALQSKKVLMHAVHNPNSTHYSSPVLLKLTNTTPVPIKIKVPVGYRFNPRSDMEQPMLVVKPEMIALQSNGKKEVALQAMCMAHDKSGPGTQTIFKLSDPVDTKHLKLAQQIDALKAYGFEGQQAVWCLTNNEPPQNIYGSDTTVMNKLRKYICEVTGKKLPPADKLNDYRYNYYAPIVNTEERIWGEYEFKFSQEKSIAIAMFDRRNTVVRELYRNDHEKPGKHIFKYEFDSKVYTDDAYKIMFIADGKVLLTRNLNIRDWRANSRPDN
jgi:hypothetical protein